MKRPRPDSEKQAWRTWAKSVRKQLPIERFSKQLANQVRKTISYQEAEHVLSYLAFSSELNLDMLYQDKKTFYITRTWSHKNLSIHSLASPLERHKLGYLQPIAEAKAYDPQIIDLVLVPGLCFDRQGGRLGYGLGYYDRLLSKCCNAVFMGISCDELIVPSLPQDSFDVSVSQLASQSGVRRLKRQ